MRVSKNEREVLDSDARVTLYVTEFGGPCRDRTYDQLIKSQLLYQLS